MILTTTPNIEGRTIQEYIGVVGGEGFENIGFRGHRYYLPTIVKARKQALDQLEENARSVGADAVIGIHVDFEVVDLSSCVLVNAAGTAVKLQ